MSLEWLLLHGGVRLLAWRRTSKMQWMPLMILLETPVNRLKPAVCCLLVIVPITVSRKNQLRKTRRLSKGKQKHAMPMPRWFVNKFQRKKPTSWSSVQTFSVRESGWIRKPRKGGSINSIVSCQYASFKILMMHFGMQLCYICAGYISGVCYLIETLALWS